MTESVIGAWARTALRPPIALAVALGVLIGLWWGGMQLMIMPEGQRIASQLERAYAQKLNAREVIAASHRVPIAGRLVAVSEEALMQDCRAQAVQHKADLIALKWQPEAKAIDVVLRGEQKALLGWWDDLGRSVRLATVRQWRWRVLPDGKRGMPLGGGLSQLEVVIQPEPWRWEAVPSS